MSVCCMRTFLKVRANNRVLRAVGSNRRMSIVNGNGSRSSYDVSNNDCRKTSYRSRVSRRTRVFEISRKFAARITCWLTVDTCWRRDDVLSSRYISFPTHTHTPCRVFSRSNCLDYWTRFNVTVPEMKIYLCIRNRI